MKGCYIRHSRTSKMMGPFELHDLLKWAWDGMISPTDLISLDGGATWKNAADLHEVSSFLRHSAEDFTPWSQSSSKRRSRRVRFIDLAPLIDVVFLLLIFFMVVSRLEPQAETSQPQNDKQIQSDLEVDLPSVPELPETEKSIETVQVMVNRDGSLMLQNERVNLSQLIHKLQQISKSKDSELQILIFADSSLPYGALVQVVAAIKSAGVGEVLLATVRE